MRYPACLPHRILTLLRDSDVGLRTPEIAVRLNANSRKVGDACLVLYEDGHVSRYGTKGKYVYAWPTVTVVIATPESRRERRLRENAPPVIVM